VQVDVGEVGTYALRQRRVVIRHQRADRVVAFLELASPGNKDRVASVDAFARKAAAVVANRHHLVVIDPFPAGRHDPKGLCAAAFAEMGGPAFDLPPDKPICVAAYHALPYDTRCYAEPLAVGDAWPDVPLFLDAEHYVNVPLEPTYAAAFAGVPRHLREAITRRDPT
jgi:hypothetical protein